MNFLIPFLILLMTYNFEIKASTNSQTEEEISKNASKASNVTLRLEDVVKPTTYSSSFFNGGKWLYYNLLGDTEKVNFLKSQSLI